MLHPTLLLLLHHGAAHGYTLMDQLGDYGLEAVDPSAVYRALREMEERGWVASTWDDEESHGPPRRVYRLTAVGADALNASMRDLQEARQKISHLVRLYDRHMEEGEGEHHSGSTG
jgi:DNA-binding PadR family transcriptional regulator